MQSLLTPSGITITSPINNLKIEATCYKIGKIVIFQGAIYPASGTIAMDDFFILLSGFPVPLVSFPQFIGVPTSN